MKTLMKTLDQSNKTLMLAVLICFASNIMYAQITVVQFMKIKPGQLDTYLEVEGRRARPPPLRRARALSARAEGDG